MFSRIYLILLLSTLLLGSCYQDVDNSTEAEEVREAPIILTETGVSGMISGLSEADGFGLKVGTQNFTSSGPFFSLSNLEVHKKGQLIEAYNGSTLIGTSFSYLVENDMNAIQLAPMISAAFNNLGPNAGNDTELFGTTDDMTFILDAAQAQNMGIAADVTDVLFTVAENRLTQAFGNSGYDKLGRLLFLHPVHGFKFDPTGGIENIQEVEAEILFPEKYISKNLFALDVEKQRWILVDEISAEPVTVGRGYFLIADSEDGVYAEGEVSHQATPISYLAGEFKGTDSRIITTEQGRWGQVLPQNDSRELEFETPCQDPFSAVTIPTSDMDRLDYEIDLSLGEEMFFELQSQIVDCSAALVDDQVVQITTTDGNRNFAVHHENEVLKVVLCPEQFEVAAYNTQTGVAGPSINWGTEIDDEVAYLSNCGEHQDGFSYLKINGEMGVLPAFTLEEEPGKTILKSEDENVKLYFNGNTTGAYAEQQINIFLNLEDFGTDGYYISCENSSLGCGITDFNVTHVDTGEGWSRVSFRGVLWMQTINNPTAGNFDIEGVIMTRN